jgi:aminoglycoside phosphotransferase (APT) family kinase protein
MQHRAPPGERTGTRAQRQAERAQFQPSATVAATRQAWDAERVINQGLGERLVRMHWPQMQGAPVRLLTEGWDNAIFRVGDDHVLRVPRRRLAIDLVRTEMQLLPLVSQRIPVAVPHPELVVDRDRDIGWPLLGCRFLPGCTADQAVPAAGSGAVLGACLARLHAIPPAEAAFLPPDRLRRMDLPYRLQQLDTMLADACAAGRIADRAPWQTIIDDARALNAADAVPTCVVHGDLHIRNLLVDAAGLPTGILDWGDAHRGDPALDLSIAVGWLDAQERSAFVAAYGSVDAAAWIRARLRAALTALWLLAWAMERRDAPLVAACHRSLDLLR